GGYAVGQRLDVPAVGSDNGYGRTVHASRVDFIVFASLFSRFPSFEGRVLVLSHWRSPPLSRPGLILHLRVASDVGCGYAVVGFGDLHQRLFAIVLGVEGIA